MKRHRKELMAGLLGMLALLVTGCDFDRGDPYQAYDDVGETDIDVRARYAARRQGRAESGTRNEGVESASQRYAHEVGEMSLDDGPRTRSVQRREKAPAPKVAPAKTENISAIRPRVPAVAEPAKSEPKTVSAPAKSAPVTIAPVRVVPAPAPAPEYRVPAASLTPKAAVREDRVSQVRSAHNFNRSSNVGEMEVGY